MGKKLEKLSQTRKQLIDQIFQEMEQANNRDKNRDIRRKILLGDLVLQKMKSGELNQSLVREWLDEYLTKEIDRKLFELPLRTEETEHQVAVNIC